MLLSVLTPLCVRGRVVSQIQFQGHIVTKDFVERTQENFNLKSGFMMRKQSCQLFFIKMVNSCNGEGSGETFPRSCSTIVC